MKYGRINSIYGSIYAISILLFVWTCISWIFLFKPIEVSAFGLVIMCVLGVIFTLLMYFGSLKYSLTKVEINESHIRISRLGYERTIKWTEVVAVLHKMIQSSLQGWVDGYVIQYMYENELETVYLENNTKLDELLKDLENKSVFHMSEVNRMI